ncbi:MAG: hypothetical protein ACI86H_001120 [bacterium]|jgi:hypothetical protein
MKKVYPLPFRGISDHTVRVLIKKQGYATLELECPCDKSTYALSEKMTNLDGYRIILIWANKPRDLDSHLVFKGNHVYYSKKRGNRSHLDVDDTNGRGPETITITKTLSGTKYIYAIHDFSNKTRKSSTWLSNSNAKVLVFIGNTQIDTIYVPRRKIGNLWVLFSIDGYDEFHKINKFTHARSSGAVKNILNNTLADSKYLDRRINKEAKRVNTLGEKTYHKRQLAQAIAYYKKAIVIKPNYSQAYSNLGLAYQKLGKTAEAIGANRRAISLAIGSRKNRVKASSFYNIAKIFEKRKQWKDAKQNFEWALQQRRHKAYKKRIKRVTQKISGN